MCALTIALPETRDLADERTGSRYFEAIAAAAPDWDKVAPGHNFFLQSAYLRFLECCPPLGLRLGYLVLYKSGEPVGVALCQFKYYKGDDSLQELEQESVKDPCFFSGLARWFKKWVAGIASADILVNGNLLLTGRHGFHFNEAKIGAEEAAQLLEKSLNDTCRKLAAKGERISVILIKDVEDDRPAERKIWKEKDFTEFDIQPNMVLKLPFSTFDEYLEAMSTKYRTRAKRARKKLDGIERKELSAEDILRENDRLYALYQSVAKNAGFNMIDLNKNYLYQFKSAFPERFRLFGYYRDGVLIAFYSTIQNYSETEAHIIGYDKDFNHDFQLYLNCLYDMVEIAVNASSDRLIFARTALEIKSSVGAEPEMLWCYLRHQNPVANKLTGKLLDYLKPVEEWVQRHPFKPGSA